MDAILLNINFLSDEISQHAEYFSMLIISFLILALVYDEDLLVIWFYWTKVTKKFGFLEEFAISQELLSMFW